MIIKYLIGVKMVVYILPPRTLLYKTPIYTTYPLKHTQNTKGLILYSHKHIQKIKRINIYIRIALNLT